MFSFVLYYSSSYSLHLNLEEVYREFLRSLWDDHDMDDTGSERDEEYCPGNHVYTSF